MKLKKNKTHGIPKMFKEQVFTFFASSKAQKTRIQILWHATKAQKT